MVSDHSGNAVCFEEAMFAQDGHRISSHPFNVRISVYSSLKIYASPGGRAS